MISTRSRVASMMAAVFVIIGVGGAGAQSLPPPASAFGLQFGWGDRDDTFERRGPELALCLTDRQIRDRIAERGYTDIALNVPGDETVQVRATMDGLVYLLQYNFCNDTIERREALRTAP